MDFKEIAKKRRSIRKYDSKKIEEDLIKDILYYGSIAPSGCNRQPWRFVVIQNNSELKDKIADIMIEKSEKYETKEAAGIRNTARVIKEAPVFIAVFNTWNNEKMNANLQSIGACIENICLAATDKGIGSLWICDIDCAFKEIEELLGKKDISLVAGIALGYALENPDERPRLKIEELTEWK